LDSTLGLEKGGRECPDRAFGLDRRQVRPWFAGPRFFVAIGSATTCGFIGPDLILLSSSGDSLQFHPQRGAYPFLPHRRAPRVRRTTARKPPVVL